MSKKRKKIGTSEARIQVSQDLWNAEFTFSLKVGSALMTTLSLWKMHNSGLTDSVPSSEILCYVTASKTPRIFILSYLTATSSIGSKGCLVKADSLLYNFHTGSLSSCGGSFRAVSLRKWWKRGCLDKLRPWKCGNIIGRTATWYVKVEALRL